eukprot:13057879-Alexandrium_andersonii.AAC.1
MGTAGAGLGPAVAVSLDESLLVGTTQLASPQRALGGAIGGIAPLVASGPHSGGQGDGHAVGVGADGEGGAPSSAISPSGYDGAVLPAVMGIVGAGFDPATTQILGETLLAGTTQPGSPQYSHCKATDIDTDGGDLI